MPYVAVTSVCAVLSVPASSSKSASAVSSRKVGVYCPFSRLGFSIVSKTVGKLSGPVGFFWSSTMRSRQNFERFQQTLRRGWVGMFRRTFRHHFVRYSGLNSFSNSVSGSRSVIRNSNPNGVGK